MKKNNINSLNSKSQKKIKISSSPQKDENYIISKYNKKIFPILNSLYPNGKYNYELNNKNASLKRSSTQDFKKTKIFPENANYLEEQNSENNEKQEPKEYNNKTNILENRKYKFKKKPEKKKKHYNNSIKEKNRHKYDYYPNNIKAENLMNIITVKEAKELKKGKNYLKSNAKPKIKKFENTEIVRTNGNEFLIYMVGYDEKRVVTYVNKLTKEFKTLPYGFGGSIGIFE